MKKETIKVGRFYCPDDPVFIGPLSKGPFEGNNLVAAMKYCKPGVAIDGGAHVGSWSIKMAEFFSEVHAFEPDSQNFSCLEMNIHGLENVKAYNKAIGDSPCRRSLKEGTNSGSGYLVDGEDFEVITVDSLNLTGLSFLKLDIEGYEPFAIEGAKETIEKYSPVVLVEQKDITARYGLHFMEAGKRLEKLGYSLVERVNNDFIYRR